MASGISSARPDGSHNSTAFGRGDSELTWDAGRDPVRQRESFPVQTLGGGTEAAGVPQDQHDLIPPSNGWIG